jgi:hypothetical protein
MEVAFEIRRAPRASCRLRRFDYIRLDIQVRWRARQSDFHSRICCNCEFGFGWDVDRMWFAAEDIRTSADFFESLRSNLEAGFASEEHCQHLTLSALGAVGFACREFQESKLQ